MGAVASDLLSRQRGTKAEQRAELRQLREAVVTAKEQNLLQSAQLFTLNQRIDDLLVRLDHEQRGEQT